jgi:hypothetical protein
MTGLTDASSFFVEKQITARSGSLAYIRPHPGSFEVAGVCEKLSTLEEVIQVTKSSLITFLDLAQALRVSVLD